MRYPFRQVTAAALAVTVAQAAFDWDSIDPNTDIEYHDCHGEYKCARLELPMDWLAPDNSTEDDRTVAIAMIKLPAAVPTNDSSYAGPVFFNPGGPGGSGVEALLGMGPYLQSRIDKPGQKHYDIISFDPRGVGFTTPTVNCYVNDGLARSIAELESRQTFQMRSGLYDPLPYSLALARAFGQRCEGQDVLPYVGTPSVARDMVAMVDKIAAKEERRTEALPRIKYLGFSYGTVLGNAFASLFPGRVGRLVLDGVSNANDYTTGPVSYHPS